MTQIIKILSNSSKIDFITEIDWNETRKLLRVNFPVNIHTNQAFFDISNGIIGRSTNDNTSWEAAKHEVCGHKFIDMSEKDYGVSLLTDCKYGFSAKGNLMGISLLKSSKNPYEKADMGVNRFIYSLYLHLDGLEGTLKEAEALNGDFRLEKGSYFDFERGIVRIDKENVVLDCLKPREKGLKGFILRVHEHLGKETCFRAVFEGLRGIKVGLVDILEREKEDLEEKARVLEVKENWFIAKIKPFKILSFKIEVL